MSYGAEDVFRMVDKIRYDCTAIQAKVSELKKALATLDLPTKEAARNACPRCGLEFKGKAKLIDHRRNVHEEDIPLPDEEAA